MDAHEVDRALELDDTWCGGLRLRWMGLIEVALFGSIASSRIGALPKFRRRVLESGERIASLIADRAWIPHPRERLKNALASARILRESLEQLERARAEIDRGSDLEVLHERASAIARALDPQLTAYEGRWAALLDRDRGAPLAADERPD